MVKGTLPKGTLVRVKDDAISPNPDSEMRRVLTNHGHLWLIDEPIKGINNGNEPQNRQWYWCRSIATGVVYDWNDDELTTFKEGDVNVE
jgi:hypothetical protein